MGELTRQLTRGLTRPLAVPLRAAPRYVGGAGPSYDPDAEALFARPAMAGTTTERKGILNTLIVALKASGAWAVRDWYHVIGATAAATHQNLKADQYNITPFNSPVFVADRYYQGDGSSAYLNTGTVLNALTHYQQDSANIAVWSGDNAPSNTNWAAGLATTGPVRVRPLDVANGLSGRINHTSGIYSAVVTSSEGFSALNRSAAAATQIYKNGAQIGTGLNTSVDPGGNPLLYMRDGTAYSPIPWLAGAGGGSLTLQQHIDEYNAIRVYLEAIGAI